MNTQINQDLANVFGQLLQRLAPLTQEQSNKIPFPESWTAAQVGEHLLKSYNVLSLLDGKVTDTKRRADEKVADLEKMFLNFDVKMKSPEFVVPSEGNIDKEALLKNLREQTGKVVNYATVNNLSLTCLDFELPGAGAFTRLEWLHFLRVHTMRHLHQLNNIIPQLSN